MKFTQLGFAAAICLSGVSAARIEKVPVHHILADIGSHRKNASSVSRQRLHGEAVGARLEIRQTAGRCGAQYSGARCPAGQCCSDYGFCGETVDHCAPLFDCQPQYGVCGWPLPPPSSTTTSAPPPPTTTSQPPPPTTTSTTTAPTTTAQPTTSVVPLPTTTTSVPLPTTTTSVPRPPTSTSVAPPVQPTGGLRITTNGQCGNGTMCIGNSQYGPCCSQFFWCGSSMDFCGAGCKPEFGACFGAFPADPNPPITNGSSPVPPTIVSPTVVVPPTSVSSVTPIVSTTVIPLPPTTTQPPSTSTTSTTSARPTTTAIQLPPGVRSSTDGRCGNGVTCLGSTFGRCCSQFGWCGDGDQFCPPIVGCQPQFGVCDS